MKKQSNVPAEKQAPAGTLVKKLVEVLADLGPVEKKSRNEHFKYNYVSEGQMMAELRDRLSSRKIFLLTSVEDCVPNFGDSKAGLFVSVKTLHTFIDAETGERMEVRSAGVGWDSGDKGVYKAITGATKYALMKNFLVTDEQNDPEAGGQYKSEKEKPAGAARHGRTKPYEEETGDAEPKVAEDRLELKTFLTANKIPDGFLLALLREKKLIDGHTTTVLALKPGIVRRLLDKKSLANLMKAWAAQQAGSAPNAPEKAPREEERSPFDSGTPDRKPIGGEPVRTREGDQTRQGLRSPVDETIPPIDVIGQEGHDNWRTVVIHWGKQTGEALGKVTKKSLAWWINEWHPKPYKGTWNEKDLLLDAALVLASRELGGGEHE